jgi:hypothetical protein
VKTSFFEVQNNPFLTFNKACFQLQKRLFCFGAKIRVNDSDFWSGVGEGKEGDFRLILRTDSSIERDDAESGIVGNILGFSKVFPLCADSIFSD